MDTANKRSKPVPGQGYMKPTWDVWCGCGNWNNVGGGRLLERAVQAVRLGWRQIRGRGWVCPECVKTLEALIAAEDRHAIEQGHESGDAMRDGSCDCDNCTGINGLHPESEADRAALAALPTDSPHVLIAADGKVIHECAGECCPTQTITVSPQSVCPTCDGKGYVAIDSLRFAEDCPACGTGRGGR